MVRFQTTIALDDVAYTVPVLDFLSADTDAALDDIQSLFYVEQGGVRVETSDDILARLIAASRVLDLATSGIDQGFTLNASPSSATGLGLNLSRNLLSTSIINENQEDQSRDLTAAALSTALTAVVLTGAVLSVPATGGLTAPLAFATIGAALSLGSTTIDLRTQGIENDRTGALLYFANVADPFIGAVFQSHQNLRNTLGLEGRDASIEAVAAGRSFSELDIILLQQDLSTLIASEKAAQLVIGIVKNVHTALTGGALEDDIESLFTTAIVETTDLLGALSAPLSGSFAVYGLMEALTENRETLADTDASIEVLDDFVSGLQETVDAMIAEEYGGSTFFYSVENLENIRDFLGTLTGGLDSDAGAFTRIGTALADTMSLGTDDGDLVGRGGDDTFVDGAGDAEYIGGAGSDTFDFRSDARGQRTDAGDRVSDDGGTIRLDGALADFTFRKDGSDLTVTHRSDGHKISVSDYFGKHAARESYGAADLLDYTFAFSGGTATTLGWSDILSLVPRSDFAAPNVGTPGDGDIATDFGITIRAFDIEVAPGARVTIDDLIRVTGGTPWAFQITDLTNRDTSGVLGSFRSGDQDDFRPYAPNDGATMIAITDAGYAEIERRALRDDDFGWHRFITGSDNRVAAEFSNPWDDHVFAYQGGYDGNQLRITMVTLPDTLPASRSDRVWDFYDLNDDNLSVRTTIGSPVGWNAPPTVTAAALSQDVTDSQLSLEIRGADPEGDPLHYELLLTALPPGANVTLNGVEMVMGSARATSLAAMTNGISATGLEPGDVLGFSVRSFDGSNFSSPALFTVTGTRPEVDFGRDTLITSVQENGPGNIPLPAARTAFLDDIAYILSGPDAGAFIYDTQTNSLRLIESADFENPADADGNGTFELSLTAADPQTNSDTIAISVRLADVFEGPLAQDDRFEIASNATAVFEVGDLLGNDGHLQGASISLEGVDRAVNGTVHLGENGSVSFTPFAGFAGPASFSYTLVDADEERASANVFLNVGDVTPNQDPSIEGAATASVTEGVAPGQTIVSLTITDAENDPLNVTLEGPDARAFTLSGEGALAFAQSPDFEAPSDADVDNHFEVTVVATDENGGTIRHDIAVTVLDDPLDNPPLAALSLTEGRITVSANAGGATLDSAVDAHVGQDVTVVDWIDLKARFAQEGPSFLAPFARETGQITGLGVTLNGDPTSAFGRFYFVAVGPVHSGFYSFDTVSFDDEATLHLGSWQGPYPYLIEPASHPGPTEGNDLLIGTELADEIAALGGHDTLLGGAGHDVLRGNTGQDLLRGGAGNDTLDGGSATDTADYALGTDDVSANLHVGVVHAGMLGNDRLIDIENMIGGAGNDTVFGSAAANRLEGGDGADLLAGLDGNDALIGGSGADALSGGDDNDLLVGGEENDRLFGNSGDDSIDGGAGDDLTNGGAGDDTINGGPDDDRFLVGGTGNDEINGGDGGDGLNGSDDNDLLRGDGGDDRLFGGTGNDTLQGGTGNDTLGGLGDNDQLFGEDGEDGLNGGGGDDLMAGGADDDRLFGGTGNDTLEGGDGDDLLVGQAGVDTYVFAANWGNDAITSYGDVASGQPRVDEVIDLSSLGISFADLTIRSNGNGGTLVFVTTDGSANNSIDILFRGPAEITQDDFLF